MSNLMVSQSARVTEICIGIIRNLACHEVPMKHIVSANGLIRTIVDQLFLDYTQCLAEACRLLTLGLQGSECRPWAEAVQSEHILSRIIWIAENTLNPQLLEKIAGMILVTLESQQEASSTLVPSLMKLGLPSLLINLLDFEISRLIEMATLLTCPSKSVFMDGLVFSLNNTTLNNSWCYIMCIIFLRNRVPGLV